MREEEKEDEGGQSDVIVPFYKFLYRNEIINTALIP